MGTRAVYSINRVPEWGEIIEKLSHDHNWIPEYIIAPSNFEERINSEFPSSVFHPVFDAQKGVPAAEFEEAASPPFDKKMFDKYSGYEHISMKMMNRMDMGYSFDYDERERTYNRLVSYWEYVIDELDLEVAVFSETPHVIGQYVLYAACVENNIKTIILTITGLPDSLLRWVFPRKYVHSSPKELVNIYRQLQDSDEECELSEETERYLSRLSTTYREAQPGFMNQDLEAIQDLLWRYSAYLRNIHKYPTYVKKLLSEAEDVTLKHRKKSLEANLPQYQFQLFRLKSAIRKRRMKRYYQSLTESPTSEDKYIYYPLHFQPERTSVPEGGIYANQYLVVDLLTETVPSDWNIYVKEHPSQFQLLTKWGHGRTTQFYDDIAALEKVRLLDVSFPQFHAIDDSEAVVTLTGTAGWEAVVRNTPAIVFGNAWYRECNGVFHVTNQAQLENAISDLTDGVSIDETNVECFAYAIEKYGERLPIREVEPGLATTATSISTLITSFFENY